MTFLPLKNWFVNISNVIHADTQEHEDHFDLTVNEIHTMKGPGSLDFGGSEFEAAQHERITPKRMNPEDSYGWWELEQGQYKVIFNEGLTDQEYSAVISAHDHARAAGLISSTVIISPDEDTNQLSLNIAVPEGGCNIKENARIATLRMVR